MLSACDMASFAQTLNTQEKVKKIVKSQKVFEHLKKIQRRSWVLAHRLTSLQHFQKVKSSVYDSIRKSEAIEPLNYGLFEL